MRKHVVLVAGMMLCCSQAGAQVEPRVAGDWKIPESAGQPAKVLHIGGDGHYQLTSAGQVVDSGRITASEGAIKLQSESGKQEQSRFSMIGGELKLHGGSIDGSWVRNGMSSQSSAVHQYEHAATPTITPSSAHTTYSSGGGSSSSQVVPPSKAIWGSVSETHTSTPSPSQTSTSSSSSAWSGSSVTPNSSAPSSNSSFSSLSPTPKSGNSSGSSSNASEGSVWNSISATGSSNGSGTAASPPTGFASAQSGSQPGQLKSTGSKIFNFVKENFNAATEAASSFSPGVTQTNGYSSGPSNNYNGYGASNSARANAFTTPSAAQRYYGSGGMPKRSTSAGIPVMKDGTARKIRFGR